MSIKLDVMIIVAGTLVLAIYSFALWELYANAPVVTWAEGISR